MNTGRFIIQVSKGLIRDQKARRHMMFYGVLIALVLLFAGSTVLWNLLRSHPLIFLAYWAACAWITLLAVLLALYDILRVRAETRRSLRELEEQITQPSRNDDDPDAR